MSLGRKTSAGKSDVTNGLKLAIAYANRECFKCTCLVLMREQCCCGSSKTMCLIGAAFAAQAIIGTTLAITGAQVWAAWFVLAIMCIYISAYAWSWGPLGWLYSSEVQPLETRSAGQSITTLVNLLFSFVIGQVTNLLPATVCSGLLE